VGKQAFDKKLEGIEALRESGDIEQIRKDPGFGNSLRALYERPGEDGPEMLGEDRNRQSASGPES